jgi:hypothetical protein
VAVEGTGYCLSATDEERTVVPLWALLGDLS